MNNKDQSNLKALLLLGILFLVSIPSISNADTCGAIRQRYWDCVRSSMNNGTCESNVTIPPECLMGAGSSSSSKSKTGETKTNTEEKKYKRGLFGTKKEIIDTTPIGYQNQENAPPPKLIRTVNIKPKGRNFLESEEEVNAYLAKVKIDLMAVIKEGRKVRLQFQ
ncbi:MAG: hypothetical protein RLZZ66_2421 [Pseudomonadota bacterium]|jgi:hypothetical protein